jgi:hypothetical protein
VLSITTNKDFQKTVYNLRRTSENAFYVAVDWDKSPGVRSGGCSVTFAQDRLELRGQDDQQWDVMVAPEGYNQSVFVTAPPTGTRSPGATPPLSRVDFPAAINPEDSRKVALQVASALIGIPFLENMLTLPVEKA